MKTSKNISFVTVGQLKKELKRFEKNHSDDDVACCLPDGTLCYVLNTMADDDGDLCINLDDEEFDGCYCDVGTLLDELKGFDPEAKAYMAVSGQYLTFSIYGENRIFDYDDENEAVSCDGDIFGHYKEPVVNSGRRTEAEDREIARKAKEETRTDKAERIVLFILTILGFCGLIYNVYTLITHSKAIWESILWIVCFLVCVSVGTVTLYNDSK